jgi:hypothetical protein
MSGDGRICDVDGCEHERELRRQRGVRRSVDVAAFCGAIAYVGISALSLGWGAATLAILVVPCAATIRRALTADSMWLP